MTIQKKPESKPKPEPKPEPEKRSIKRLTVVGGALAEIVSAIVSLDEAKGADDKEKMRLLILYLREKATGLERESQG